MLVFQFALILLIVFLDFGLLGRQLTSTFSLGLGVLATWAFAWFSDQKSAFRFAVLLGLFFDLVSFMGFGTWLVAFCGAYLITDLLKSRFFEASSISLSLATLALASGWAAFVLGVSARAFDVMAVFGGVATNVLVGFVVYYFLAIRFKFFQRWRGRRL